MNETEKDTIGQEVIAGARALHRHGLVTAFGHVSVRLRTETFWITPPRPLGSLQADTPLTEVDLGKPGLPEGVPGEGWIHQAIYAHRPDVRAVCRAQPHTPTALAAAGVPVRALHGQGAFLGREVPVFDDARLIRDQELGEKVARRLASGNAVILRGNGAVTTGSSIGAAVARMWVLEASATINRDAASIGSQSVLSEEEFSFWESVSDEILERIWDYLKEQPHWRR